MDFNLTQTQSLFAESMNRFLRDQYDFRQREQILTSSSGFRDDHWRTLADMGVLGASFPEAYGGLGEDWVTTTMIMELFGRALFVSPFVATVLLGGGLVLSAGTDEQRHALLPGIAAGERKFAFAFAERDGGFDVANVALRAEVSNTGFAVSGAKCVVLFAAAADTFIVLARTAGEPGDADGLTLLLVDAAAAGITRRDYRTQDGGCASDLVFDRVEVGADAVLGHVSSARDHVERVLDDASVAVAGEATGMMWAVLEQTTEYTKARHQFGQSLSSFQVLQHRMADMYMKCEIARTITFDAARRLSVGQPLESRRQVVSATKYLVGKLGQEVGYDGVHLHGAAGMTAETAVGHYLKRITLMNLTFGDRTYHLRRYLTGMTAASVPAGSRGSQGAGR